MMDRTTIRELFKKHGTDKGWLHDYSEMYADVFTYIPTPSKIVEVGVKNGKSLAAWIELFPAAYIVGVDINTELKIVPNAAPADILIVDSQKPILAQKLGTDCDVIIDDGNHNVKVQWRTFKNLHKCCKGAYVIEDIYGDEAVEMIEGLLRKNNFTNVKRYTSKKTDAVVTLKDGTESPPFAFYSLVIKK